MWRCRRCGGSRVRNVVVVDWQSITAGQSAWFEDGPHLTEAGKAAYAAAVRDALSE
jgi:hypothetical protein